jgi:hypothetical protein
MIARGRAAVKRGRSGKARVAPLPPLPRLSPFALPFPCPSPAHLALPFPPLPPFPPCPSPFAAARLPFAAPLLLLSPVLSPCFLRSLGLSAPSLAPLLPGIDFVFSRPSLRFVRPGFRAAIPRENPVRPGFSAWRNPALAVSDPGTFRCSIGLPDWPRGIQAAPGDGSRRGWEAGGGAAVSWPSNGISSGISNVISNGTRVRGGWGGGRREIGRVRVSSSGPAGRSLAGSRIRGAGSKPRRWVVVFAATWAAVKDGSGDRWQRPGPSRKAPKAPCNRLSPAEQRH